MSWLFSYFVESRHSYVHREPTPWLNVELLASNCPNAIIHCGETHALHKYGAHIKNLGLRTCLIIETPSDDEAIILRLLNDQVINSSHSENGRAPTLQLVLEHPDWDALDEISRSLDDHKLLDPKRRGDLRAIDLLQRQIVRVNTTIDDLDGVASSDFQMQTNLFVDSSYLEIKRIQLENKALASRVKAVRRELFKKLLSYATFVLSQNLK